jgi:hypothetical protein
MVRKMKTALTLVALTFAFGLQVSLYAQDSMKHEDKTKTRLSTPVMVLMRHGDAKYSGGMGIARQTSRHSLGNITQNGDNGHCITRRTAIIVVYAPAPSGPWPPPKSRAIEE